MRFGRTLPPAAAPITHANLRSGVRAVFRGASAIAHFRAELEDYFQTKHCFLVSSGKAALLLTLTALKELHPERDEVLVPAFNCFSVPSAIVRAGLKITLCDIDPETLDFDYAQVRTKLDNPRLLCVIPTHLFGRPADIFRLKVMLAGSMVTVIEDAAQAFGGEVAGRKLGTLGDVGLFSLGRGKALSTVEGGIVLTNRTDLAREIEKVHARLPACSLLRTLKLGLHALTLAILQHPLLYWLPNSLRFLKLGQTLYDPAFEALGYTAFQCGLAKGWQSRIADLKQIRKRHSAEWAIFLDGLSQIHYGRHWGESPALIGFPWQVKSKDLRSQILKKSRQIGLGIAAVYPSSIARIPSLKKTFQLEIYPIAEHCAGTLVTLPVHPLLKAQDIEKIKRIISDVAGNEGARIADKVKVLGESSLQSQ